MNTPHFHLVPFSTAKTTEPLRFFFTITVKSTGTLKTDSMRTSGNEDIRVVGAEATRPTLASSRCRHRHRQGRTAVAFLIPHLLHVAAEFGEKLSRPHPNLRYQPMGVSPEVCQVVIAQKKKKKERHMLQETLSQIAEHIFRVCHGRETTITCLLLSPP